MRWLVLVPFLAVTMLACSGGEDGTTNSGPSGGSTTGGTTSGSGGGTATSGGTTATGGSGALPTAWGKPADCGGVGEACVFQTCDTSRATCQLQGNVCIPNTLVNGQPPPKSPERPYCFAYTCMSFEEASCLCSGPLAADFSECRAGPGAASGACVDVGYDCRSSACCADLVCVHAEPTDIKCQEPCASPSECDTGCCTDLKDTGDLVCAAAEACANPCKKAGESCTDERDCCRGTCVTSTNPEIAGCRQRCDTDSECDSGCCARFPNNETGYCLAARFCP